MQSGIKNICDKHISKLAELRKQNEAHKRLFSGLPETKENYEKKPRYALVLEIKQVKAEKTAWEEETIRLRAMLSSLSEELKVEKAKNYNLNQRLREEENKTVLLQSTKDINKRLKNSLFQKVHQRWTYRKLAAGFRSWISHGKS